MKINFINRSTEGFSIEKVFELVKQRLPSEIIQLNWFAPSKYDLPKSLLRNYFYFWCKRIFFSKKKDIFHITGVLHYLFWILPKYRTVLTIHDCVKVHQQKGFKKWFTILVWFRLPTSYFKYITVVSEQTKNELISLTNCDPKKIEVIYNPLDPEIVFVPKEFNAFCPSILHIGTNKNKNLDRLIIALEGINCELVIVGKIDEAIVNLLAKNNINYRQFQKCSDEEIRQLYREADIISFVTTYEGFGMPIIEAQATGRVVLTSNIQPHKEVAGEGALFVNPRKIEEIRKGLLTLISNPELRKIFIEKGYINAQKFKADLISDKYFSLYQMIVTSIL